MAKRFIDTNIWTQNKWFRKLEPKYKIFWFYLLSNCDSVGVWEEDIELASYIIGYEYSMEDIIKVYENRIRKFNGKKIWIVDFCDFQYGVLKESEKNRPHKSYIELLKKHSLYIEYLKTMDSHKEKEKEKEEEEDKEKEKKNKKITPIEFYKNEIEKSGNNPNYKTYVNALFGENEAGLKLSGVLSLRDQMSYDQFQKLIAKAKEKGESLIKLTMSFENGGYWKNKKSLYLSINDWLNKR